MTRRRRVVSLAGGLAAAAVALGGTIAAAASLPVTAKSLTVFTASSTVPLSSCTVTAAADAYVDGAVLNSGSNFGTATTLSVRSDVLGNRRAFARFDLSSCTGFANPRVTSATLQLFLATAPSSSRTYQLHRAAATWTESGITWSNQPATAASATATAATGTTSGVTLSWAVTPDVQSFADGTTTNFGWRVRDATEDSLSAVTGTFASREDGTATRRPKLVVSYYP